MLAEKNDRDFLILNMLIKYGITPFAPDGKGMAFSHLEGSERQD